MVVNLGEKHGIEKGHVLAISKAGEITTDPYARKDQEELVSLPDAHTADAMVFRVFHNLSYVFILDANRPVRSGDIVTSRQ